MAANVQDMAAARHSGVLARLQLRPQDFPAYLTRQLGFTLVRHLTLPNTARGFDRPIYLFQKRGAHN